MKVWKIYKITNRTSGKSYIGLTSKPLARRFKEHVHEAYHGVRRHRNGTRYAIHAALIKYGDENFTIEEIDSHLSLEEGREREIYYIKKYNSYASNANLPNMPRGYNETPGGEIPDAGEHAYAAQLKETSRGTNEHQSNVKNSSNKSPVDTVLLRPIDQSDIPKTSYQSSKNNASNLNSIEGFFRNILKTAVVLVVMLILLDLFFSTSSDDTDTADSGRAEGFENERVPSVQNVQRHTQEQNDIRSRGEITLPSNRDINNTDNASTQTADDRTIEQVIRAPDMPDLVIAAERINDSNMPQLEYPRPALIRGLTGVVKLSFVIEPTGDIGDMFVEQSSGHGVLDRAAIDHVKSDWRYTPQTRNGVPEYSSDAALIRFELH